MKPKDWEERPGKRSKERKGAKDSKESEDEDSAANEAATRFAQLPLDVQNQFKQKGAAFTASLSQHASASTAAFTPLRGLRSASVPASSDTGMYNWLLDSGATHSMTPYRHNYISFTVADIEIRVANRETTSAEGYGDVLIDLKQEDKSIPFLIKNVWFVPCLDTNLLSIAELAEDKVTIYFNAPELPSLIFRENSYLGAIQLVNRKYWLSTTGVEPETFQTTLVENNLATALATTGCKQLSVYTWHRRLGHLGPQNLVQLKQVCTGMDFDDHFTASCPDCILANSTAKPHSGATSSLSGKPYELVYIDV